MNGTLTLTSGNVTLGANNLTLSSTAILSGTPSVNNMIVPIGAGQFIRGIPFIASSTSELFPVGDATPNYTPVNLNFAFNVTAGTVGAVSYTHLDVYKRQHLYFRNIQRQYLFRRAGNKL